MLTLEHVKSLLSYDPATGIFRWEINTGSARKGCEAGCINSNGYRYIEIAGIAYRAHRLAWLWVTGKWPMGHLDHANRNKTDNRFINLRLATRQQNSANRKVAKHNLSGLKGVNNSAQRYRARIRVGGRLIHLGYFDTPNAAHAAYCIAADQYFGVFANNGE